MSKLSAFLESTLVLKNVRLADSSPGLVEFSILLYIELKRPAVKRGDNHRKPEANDRDVLDRNRFRVDPCQSHRLYGSDEDLPASRMLTHRATLAHVEKSGDVWRCCLKHWKESTAQRNTGIHSEALAADILASMWVAFLMQWSVVCLLLTKG